MLRMNRFRSISLAVAAAVVASTGLTGCAGFSGASFPDASANPAQTPLGTIQGSNYGGHAPLVGAHVYVLQPSVTTPGGTSQATGEYNVYAGQATSLLTASYNNNGSNYPATIQNTGDPGIPTSWYYLQTDQTGAFNISGDYTCTAGIPVYLYLYGGTPQYPAGGTPATNTYNISSWTATGSSGNYTVTFTIPTTGQYATNPIENAYIGELFSVTANSSALPAGSAPFNQNLQYVVAGSGSSALSTTQFSFTYTGSALPGGASTGTTYSQTGTNMTVTFLPYFNTAVVNLAILGNCPSTGSFSSTNAISYVYVNEVSTVAAAYAFRPFTFTPNTSNLINGAAAQTSCTTTYNSTTYYWNNATCIGTSAGNLAGLQNAANIAKQLYDITGSQISTTYAGEGHIANSLTVAKNGIVPQANLDTLGNILAACVDSDNNGSTVVTTNVTNSYSGNGANANISSQCNTLFTNATSSGIPTTSGGSGANAPGIQPFDTAMAAINIARHPGGPPYSYTNSTSGSTAFMTALYTLPTGNRPFEPDIASTAATQPNDFTIGILYPASLNTGANGGAYTNVAESLAIDNIGNVWVTAQNGGAPYYFYEISPAGVISNVQHQTNYIYGYTSVDTNQNAWAGAASDVQTYGGSTPYAYGFTYVQKTGTTSSGTVYPNPYTYGTGAVNSNKLESYTYASAADALGNVYFGNNGTYSANSITAGRPTDFIETLSGAATNPGVTGTESAQIPTFTSLDGGVTHMAIQPPISGVYSAYIDYNNSDGNGTAYLASVILSSGANNWTELTKASSGCSGLVDPEHMAVTRNGDALYADFDNGAGTVNTATSSLYFVTGLATATPGTCAQISGLTQEAGLNSPFGVAIDGSDYAYITNRGNSNGTTISVLNMTSASSTVTSVSPAGGFQPTYVSGTTLTNELNGPLNIAVAPSGTVWVTNPAGNSLVEIVGLATPATTPLATAAQTIANNYTVGTVGLRP